MIFFESLSFFKTFRGGGFSATCQNSDEILPPLPNLLSLFLNFAGERLQATCQNCDEFSSQFFFFTGGLIFYMRLSISINGWCPPVHMSVRNALNENWGVNKIRPKGRNYRVSQKIRAAPLPPPNTHVKLM